MGELFKLASSDRISGPDGRDYPNKIIFMEVVKPEKLVYRHVGVNAGRGSDPINQVRAAFQGYVCASSLRYYDCFVWREALRSNLYRQER